MRVPKKTDTIDGCYSPDKTIGEGGEEVKSKNDDMSKTGTLNQTAEVVNGSNTVNSMIREMKDSKNAFDTHETSMVKTDLPIKEVGERLHININEVEKKEYEKKLKIVPPIRSPREKINSPVRSSCSSPYGAKKVGLRSNLKREETRSNA